MSHLGPQAAAARREVISFRIAEQAYCIDIMSVREIRGWTSITPLPLAPAHVRGVINLRGAVLPILDLAVCLGLPSRDGTMRSAVIVIETGGRLAGLLVDAVSDILSVTEQMIQAPPELACDPARRAIGGLITIEDRMISEIAIAALLADAAAIPAAA